MRVMERKKVIKMSRRIWRKVSDPGFKGTEIVSFRCRNGSEENIGISDRITSPSGIHSGKRACTFLKYFRVAKKPVPFSRPRREGELEDSTGADEL